MNSPAWQAIMPELVPREQLPDAVALNSAGFNLARALGPALGGLAVAAFVHADTGAAWTFLLNALSFVGVILVLYQWKRKPAFKSALPAERIYGSMRAGLRYIQYAPPLKAALGGRSFSPSLSARCGRCWRWSPRAICTRGRSATAF
jgi:MFS family permease